MKFSLFQSPCCFDRDRDGDCIAKTIRQAELADEYGFDGVWLPEHHFTDTSIYGDPLVFAGAIAARTSRIAIGFGVIQLGLHNPVRLASQIALLDRISGGRIRVGVSRGDNELEYLGFGLPYEHARERFEEGLEILLKCWTGEEFRHRGTFYKLDVAGIRPSPAQKPHPPIYQSALSPESIARIGRAGYSLMLPRLTGTAIAERLQVYRDALEAGGHPADVVDERVREVTFSKNIYLAPTDAEAWDDIREPTERQLIGLADQHAMIERMRGGTSTAEHEAPARVPYEMTPTMRRGLIVGSPESVLEQLHEQEGRGVHHVLANMDWGDMPQEKVERSLGLLAERVLPALAG